MLWSVTCECILRQTIIIYVANIKIVQNFLKNTYPEEKSERRGRERKSILAGFNSGDSLKLFAHEFLLQHCCKFEIFPNKARRGKPFPFSLLI